MKHASYLPLYIFAFSVALALTIPILIQDGMFFDAVLYTSVSHNMSIGLGNFWFPYFDENNLASLPSFHEQPPLVFYIQHLFFNLLGDNIYVERFYALLMLIINAFLILKIWNTVFTADEKIKQMGWLSIILWITIPVCFWSYANCMHEITMSVFTSLAILFTVKYYYQKRNILYLLIAGVMIVLSFMCKGFPGLYPIGISFFYWIIVKKISFKQMVFDSLIPLTILIAFACFVWFNADAHKSIIDYYLIKRAFQRISNTPTTDSRLFIFFRLLSELIPALIFSGLLLIIAKFKNKINLVLKPKKEFYLFLLIGLSGSVPLMLTTVQKGFYMVASLQNFGIAFAILVAPVLHSIMDTHYEKYKSKYLKISIGLLLIVLIIPTLLFGKYSREENIIRDVYAIKNYIPKHEYMQAAGPNELVNFPFQMYMMRYNNIGIRSKKSNYYFIEKNNPVMVSDSLQKIKIVTRVFDFYKRVK